MSGRVCVCVCVCVLMRSLVHFGLVPMNARLTNAYTHACSPSASTHSSSFSFSFFSVRKRSTAIHAMLEILFLGGGVPYPCVLPSLPTDCLATKQVEPSLNDERLNCIHGGRLSLSWHSVTIPRFSPSPPPCSRYFLLCFRRRGPSGLSPWNRIIWL